MTTQALWRLLPFHVGVCQLGEKHVLDDLHSDDHRMPFAMYAFYAERGDRKVLIDLGPKTLEFTNDMFRRYGFFREEGDGCKHPDDVVQPHGNVFDHLRRIGVAPQEITDLFFTHLHADHHGMDTPETAGALLDFPTATIRISAKGWQYNLDKRENGRWNSYLDHAFGDHLLERDRRGQLVARDDDEAAPGLRTVFLGGHAPCSQAIVVQTEAGPAVITSDDIYRYDLLAQAILARIHITPEALLAATERMVRLVETEDGLLLPVHDDTVWNLYQEHGARWLFAARDLTREAVAAYRARTPTCAGTPVCSG